MTFAFVLRIMKPVRRDLPAGTVTFLFTDVEGSTRLLHELGADEYAKALAEHRRLLREVFARHGGVEVDTQGDALFIVFTRATEAVAAAAEVQQALTDQRVRVRVGVHTGEPVVTNEGYVGLDVHRAARIAAAGHGGQVLLSATTRDLVQGPIELRALGEHRLKDLTEPQRLYQLGHAEFPPLKSLNQTNLPVQPTPFVGRERELAEVLELLRKHRLVTLTGAGGSGKTRLALHAAAELVDELRDGVWFVSVAALRAPELVEPTIAQTFGVNKQPGEPLTRTITEQLEDKVLLLVVDNFEHVVEAASKIAELLERTPKLKVLVTSREPLHLAAEREYAVPPLDEPEAVALFHERAVSSEPEDVVRKICRRLDCLPLAVELAAARMKGLSSAQLLDRLERRLPLLTGAPRDAPERQRTLRATIEWSHELLHAPERTLFRRLAVFVGSFDLKAAEEICEADLDTLQSLLEKNLVRREGERMALFETIGEYAHERLELSEELSDLRHRHAEHFLRRLEGAAADRSSGVDEESLSAWAARERDNLRAALASFRDLGDPVGELRLATALAQFHSVELLVERRRILQEALSVNENPPPKLEANALLDLAHLSLRQGDAPAARSAAEESLRLFQEMGDDAGSARALMKLGATAVEEGDMTVAAARYDASGELFRRLRDPIGLAAYLHDRADLALRATDWARALELAEEGMSLRRSRGLHEGAGLLYNAALALLGLGRVAEAEPAYRRGLERGLSIGDRSGICLGLLGLSSVAEREGRIQYAARLLGAAERLLDETGLSLSGAELNHYEHLRSSLAAQLGPRLAAALAVGRSQDSEAVAADIVSVD